MKTTLQTLNQIPSQGFVMKNGEKVQTNFTLVPTETFMKYFHEVSKIYEEIKKENQTDIFIEKILDESDDSLIVNTTIEVLPDKNYNYIFTKNLRTIRNVIKKELKNNRLFSRLYIRLNYIRENYENDFFNFVEKISEFSGELSPEEFMSKFKVVIDTICQVLPKILPLNGEINWMSINRLKKLHIDFKDTPTLKVFLHDMKLHIIITKKDSEYKNYLYNFKFVFPVLITPSYLIYI